MMQDFRKLRVWQDAMDVVVSVYRATALLPVEERYGLTAQMRTAAVSIVSNIAEGCGRPTRRDMARFLGVAIGSACELESQVMLVARLGLVEDEIVEGISGDINRVRRQAIALRSRVLATPVRTSEYPLEG